jgi:ribosomal protein S18 acetylase RimI-like enzyme
VRAAWAGMSGHPNRPQTEADARAAARTLRVGRAVDRLSMRPIVPADATLVAALQVANWRSIHRGVLSDDYLADTVEEERRSLWQQRLIADDADHLGLVAARDGVVVGFAFAIAAADVRYGNLLDNLHVSTGSQGHGIGRILLSELAREIQARRWENGLFLWVFEANVGARRFYERLGALPLEAIVRHAPDGGTVRRRRYVWPDVTALILPEAGSGAKGG